MNNDMNNDMKEIRNIENKYGLIIFRMGLSHLADVGHRNLSKENIEESIKQIMAEKDESRKNGKIPIITPEFQCEILHCAAELSRFSIWTLFAYIKNYVDIGDL